MTFFRGDNTQAFDNNFLEIDLDTEGKEVSKAIFICGKVQKHYIDPKFPMIVNFNESESSQLRAVNTCYLVIYDRHGRQQTLEQSFSFETKQGVINE